MNNGDQFINGEWVAGTGPTFASINPATGEEVLKAHAATSAEVDKAVSAARNAFEGWADLTLDNRIQYLQHFVELLKHNQNSLAKAISRETGKPLWDSTNEVSAMIGKIPISIEAHKTRCGQLEKEVPSGKSITRHKPHGAVAVFGPFNFPGHLPNGHIVPALLAGNTVVFKPSEYTPYTAILTIQCWEQANLPKGVINLVQGGRETGSALSSHPGIDGLFFTGSWQTGHFFSEQFGKHPEKILALEMGGNNPLVIGNILDMMAAALITVQSAYLTSGQRCTCARRLIIPEGPKTKLFLKALVDVIHRIHVGPYTDLPEPFMGPVISKKAAQNILSAHDNLIKLGGRPLVEMKLLSPGSAFLSPGLMDVTKVKNRPDEEIFGPFLQLIRVADFDSAIEEANRTGYGLSAGLVSEQAAEFDKFFKRVKAGVINWNTPLTGASSAAPFGGIGKSGNHRPSAYYAADYCSYPVASMESEKLKMPPPPIGISTFR